MQFTLTDLDLSGSLSNPIIAIGICFWALIVSVAVVPAMRSRKSEDIKLLWFLGGLLLAFVGQEPFSRSIAVALARTDCPSSRCGIGFIGHAPWFVAPAIYAAFALPYWLFRTWRRRARAS